MTKMTNHGSAEKAKILYQVGLLDEDQYNYNRKSWYVEYNVLSSDILLPSNNKTYNTNN